MPTPRTSGRLARRAWLLTITALAVAVAVMALALLVLSGWLVVTFL